MALTRLRWLVAGAIGCVLVWFAVLGRKPKYQEPAQYQNAFTNSYVPSEADRVWRPLARLNDRLRALEIRDSVEAAFRGTATFAVGIDPAVDAETRTRLDSLLHAAWGRLQIPGARRVIVAVVVDSLNRPNGLPRQRENFSTLPIETFLPNADTHDACITVLRLRFALGVSSYQFVRQTRSGIVLPETVAALLGTCAFVARFGVPGPGVSSWLFNNHWAPARFAAWNAPAVRWTSDANPSGLSTLQRVIFTSDPDWRVRAVVNGAGIACVAGVRDTCREMFLARTAPATDTAWQQAVVSSSGSSPSDFFLSQRATELGPGGGWVASEMVRSLGPDRFEQFWTSGLAPNDAFKNATGQDVENWMSEWAHQMYGPATVGPTVTFAAIVAGLIVLVAALLFSSYVGERRRVT